jgi:hypothetical protein
MARAGSKFAVTRQPRVITRRDRRPGGFVRDTAAQVEAVHGDVCGTPPCRSSAAFRRKWESRRGTSGCVCTAPGGAPALVCPELRDRPGPRLPKLWFSDSSPGGHAGNLPKNLHNANGPPRRRPVIVLSHRGAAQIRTGGGGFAVLRIPQLETTS